MMIEKSPPGLFFLYADVCYFNFDRRKHYSFYNEIKQTEYRHSKFGTVRTVYMVGYYYSCRKSVYVESRPF